MYLNLEVTRVPVYLQHLLQCPIRLIFTLSEMNLLIERGIIFLRIFFLIIYFTAEVGKYWCLYFNHKCLKLNPLQMKSCTLIEKETQWMEIFIFHYVLLNELNCTEWKHNDIFSHFKYFFIYSCIWLYNHFSDCACNFGGDPSSHIDVIESCSSKNISWALASAFTL